jgi:aromatic ring-opening dioxygenase LigB subunit
VEFQNDGQLAAQIARLAAARELRTETISEGELDHGAVVPPLFVAEAGWRAPIVILSLGLGEDLNVVNFGEAVAHAAEGTGSRVAFIASGDMSHRLTPNAPHGFDPRGAKFDEWLEQTAPRRLP